MLDYETMQECADDGFYGVASHVSEEDKPKIISLTKSLQKPGDMVKFEYQAKSKFGDTRWISASSQFLKLDKNQNPVIQRTMTDITEKMDVNQEIVAELKKQMEMFVDL